MNFIPLGDRILVEVLEEPKVTAGGIYVPDSAEGKPSRGTVLHAGESPRIKEGEVVIFGNYSGTVVNDGARDLLLISVRDILAIVKEEKS